MVDPASRPVRVLVTGAGGPAAVSFMRAVEAGSIWGGDVRCNTEDTRQTAAMAFIVAARGTDAPYATDSIGRSDQGTSRAPWLAISVRGERGGDNPLLELRLRYDRWRRGAAATGTGRE